MAGNVLGQLWIGHPCIVRVSGAEVGILAQRAARDALGTPGVASARRTSRGSWSFPRRWIIGQNRLTFGQPMTNATRPHRSDGMIELTTSALIARLSPEVMLSGTKND